MLSWGLICQGGGEDGGGTLSRKSPGLKFRFVENEAFLSEGKNRAVSFSLSGPTSTGGLTQAQGKHLKMSL